MAVFLNELPAVNSIQVGNIYQKPSAVHELLGMSVRLVAHEHRYDDQSYFSQTGSCTLVSYGGNAFVVTTRHQLNLAPNQEPDGHFETIRFSTSSRGIMKNIPVDRSLLEESNPDQEYHDLLFFGVHAPWLRESADRPYFFPVEGFSRNARRLSFFYGHPRSRTEFQYEPHHAYVRQAFIDGVLDTDFSSHAEYFRRYRYEKTDYEVDGFSGGAAFSLFGTLEEGFRIALDGIIVRGGNGYLYVVDTDYIARAIAKFQKP